MNKRTKSINLDNVIDLKIKEIELLIINASNNGEFYCSVFINSKISFNVVNKLKTLDYTIIKADINLDTIDGEKYIIDWN